MQATKKGSELGRLKMVGGQEDMIIDVAIEMAKSV